MVLF
ncbi:hypothetical protein D050_1913A, partial [Vibrio parahaemolyticus VPCR-2009]